MYYLLIHLCITLSLRRPLLISHCLSLSVLYSLLYSFGLCFRLHGINASIYDAAVDYFLVLTNLCRTHPLLPPFPFLCTHPPSVDYCSRAVAEQLRRDWNRRRYRLGALNCSTHTHPRCPPTGALRGRGEVETRRYSRCSLAYHILCMRARSQSRSSACERVLCVYVCVYHGMCVCVCVCVCVRACKLSTQRHTFKLKFKMFQHL